ncbi:MAG: hypothetical protein ABFD97_18240 [Syntrophobacter sp.]
MRTLFEIIESAKDGNKPNHEECYWSMLALEALSTFDSIALRRLADGKERKFMTAEWQHKESWNRWKRALGVSPRHWVGPNNDPESPDYQRMRSISKKLFYKVMKELDAESPNNSPTKQDIKSE